MSLDRKLARWVGAGLIDEAARGRIAAFEEAQRRPFVLYALAVLGGGTVALGVVSVIASNWEQISPQLKLACDLLIGAALAFATAAAASSKRAWATEVLVTIYYGFTLASLALVGQIYQLGTPTYQGLLVWSAATLPLVLLGESRYLAAIFCAGLFVTHGLSLEALFEYLEHDLDRHDAFAGNLIATLLFASPLAYIALSRVGWLVRWRPEYSRTLGVLAWAGLLLAGFGLQFCWYDRISANDTISWGLGSTGVLAGVFAAALPRLYPEFPRAAQATLMVIVGFGWLTLAIGTGLPHGSANVVGALLQLAWLGLFARASLQFGRLREFNSLTALIALRVIVVYFEVFGSLLDTGLGLITGGALTLLVAWFWRRKTQSLTERMRSEARSNHVA